MLAVAGSTQSCVYCTCDYMYKWRVVSRDVAGVDADEHAGVGQHRPAAHTHARRLPRRRLRLGHRRQRGESLDLRVRMRVCVRMREGSFPTADSHAYNGTTYKSAHMAH